MKKCSYCGTEYPDDVVTCSIDQTLLDISSSVPKLSKIPPYYTPGQMALACFLGSPIAAGWLIARTYHGTGEKKKERLSLILSAVVTTALIVIGFILPETTPKSIMAPVATIATFHTAKYYLGPTIESRASSGALKGSWWMAAGVGLLCMIVLLALVVAIMLLYD